jgi:pimeloyl-ACP methyl ester carboxylesterase
MIVMVTADGRAGAAIRESELHGGLPCLVVGSGPPLIVLPGLSPENRLPTGADRTGQLRSVQMLTDRFTVHLVNRRPGLEPGTTMHDLANDVAAAIRELEWPVPVVGISTGGSVALQLAMDHPGIISRLVLWAAACRLGPEGRRRQLALAAHTRAGHPRRAWATLGPAMAGTPLTRASMSAVLWLMGSSMDPDDPADLLATIESEDAFDVTDQLHRVTAPTLVIGGARDGFYSRSLFERTAHGILGARLLLYPRRSHMGTLSYRPAQREIAAFLAEERST